MSQVPTLSSLPSIRSQRSHLHHQPLKGDVRTVPFRLHPEPRNKKQKSEFPTNYVRTAKYTFYSFLFINLFEQFSRIANLYFLFIAALQLIPQLSPTHWITTIAPLVFVLSINAAKEIYDDYYRHKSDGEVNNREVDVLVVGSRPVRSKWRDLRVGDIVKVVRDQEFPADLLFLSSPDDDGLCWVETANLDGETNLKLKNCYPASKACQQAEQLAKELGGKRLECECPNEKLYQFEGAVVGSREEGLDASNLLLRGSTLRKTEWIIGAVVFSGEHTKIRRNQSAAPRKVTQLERHMNMLVLVVFAVQILFSAGGAIGRDIWLRQHNGDYYLEGTSGWPEFGPGVEGTLVTFLRFVILINVMIPISLYVTLEVVKVAQCLFLNWDLEMYHEDTDTPFQCRTTTLNEDLGQVEYVLSDKTGTLTQNVMGFVWASIGGHLYGRDSRDVAGDLNPAKGVKLDTPHSIALDPNLRTSIERRSSRRPQKERGGVDTATGDFFFHLAVCNTVVPSAGDDNEPVYQAESPDEEALVKGARYLGYVLMARSVDAVQLEVLGQRVDLKVLAVLEFNSARKRMSIICRLPNGKIRLYCKGADTVIMARLGDRKQNRHATCDHLNEMASAGLRTLVVAYRDLSEDLFNEWYDKYHKASVSLVQREAKVEEAADAIERNLVLLGATAVEDKLQEGVPETIDRLSRAGIKVWMLTGDKLETAVSISHSCSLFQPGMKLVFLREEDFSDTTMAKAALAQAREDVIRLTVEQRRVGLTTAVGLVVDGGALAVVLKVKFQDEFLSMCKQCRAVVCCRVSPLQKAQVTNLVKCKAGAIALGIGDGANDVGMIQSAHIGVGISGREGRAAVLASDFSMAQFRFLSRLLLVHGRWSYRRNTEVVMYAFYKNFAYVMANVYLNYFISGFSTQPMYNAALIATYNAFWTSLPTIAYAILEKDVQAETMMATPELYMEAMRSDWRSFFRSLSSWLFYALVHSIIVFLWPMYALVWPEPDGKLLGLNAAGVAVYTAVIITVNLKVAVRTHHWTALNALVIWGISIGMWFPFMYVCSLLWQWWEVLPDMAGVAQRLFSVPAFWLSAVIGAPMFSILLDFSMMAFEDQFRPSDTRIFQEREQKHGISGGMQEATSTTTAGLFDARHPGDSGSPLPRDAALP
ncbi:unnamed protein product [Ostreobium quekettii]|uniref:Phospholipid-transporting ATPase n=1 Tax=Ostreobium quekettii TaxID=121088 RepID=A0A8S1J9N7_9CHLO|nr:unnamed protein product [Ostreobium quekettii]